MRAKPRKTLALRKSAKPVKRAAALLADVRGLIEQAREGVARTVNAGLALHYWQVGTRVRQEILKEQRADYGAKIVVTLSRQLGWSHFVALLPLDDELQRDFYAEMCRVERWDVRTLRKKIGGMLYERTALSRKPDKLIRRELAALRKDDRLTPEMVFREPYFLDFLGLKDAYAEKDIETAILREIEAFIIEMGAGFCFVARQKRMQIDDRDYHLDLLFYHRKLRRLVALDLKLGEFEAADKGQMELYLAWLKRHECEPGEAEPLGIILCAGKSDRHVELLELAKSGIHVASYWTKLLPKKLLERKLLEAVRHARARVKPRD